MAVFTQSQRTEIRQQASRRFTTCRDFTQCSMKIQSVGKLYSEESYNLRILLRRNKVTILFRYCIFSHKTRAHISCVKQRQYSLRIIIKHCLQSGERERGREDKISRAEISRFFRNTRDDS